MAASASHNISVQTPEGDYDVIVRPGILNQAGEIVRKLHPTTKKIAIVTDTNVAPLYAERLADTFERVGMRVVFALLKPGEKHKTLADLETVYDSLLAAKIERSTPVVALGGGIIGDMAGFAAATVLRGVPFIQIPTTLLAMVDASVGGKTGVNAPHFGKNLIGAFYQPDIVLADTTVLKSLGEQELRDGLAECVKHDIIRDVAGFVRLEREVTHAFKREPDWLADLVAHNVSIKAAVVSADPFERGDRAHLNLGHTFGHAIEKVSEHAFTHGQAVSLGIAAAAFVSSNIGLLDHSSFEHIISLLHRCGLPTSGIATGDAEAIVEAMRSDKKVRDGKIRLVLPEGIGKAVVRDDIPLHTVRDAIGFLERDDVTASSLGGW